MTDQQQTSGLDLARIAVANARRAAKTAPQKGSRRHKPDRRRDSRAGRDPIGLGSAIDRMIAERGWEPAAAGGSILDQWPAIAPELAGMVTAESYDADTATLHLRPHSDAAGTQLRVFEAAMVKRINDKIGSRVVRRLRVLGVRPGEDTETYTADSLSTAERLPEPGPVKTRDTASPGYRQARAAITRTSHGPAAPAGIEEVRARQENALRAHREPETAFTDGMAETERLEEQERHRTSAEAVRQAAIARKYAGDKPVRRIFGAA